MAKTRFIKIMSWIGGMALLLSACGIPIEIGGQPVVIGISSDYDPSNGDYHTYTTNQGQSESESTGLQEIHVEDVRVEIGVGSPLPVKVKVSGTWPGLCSQLAEVKQTSDEKTFDIHLLATPDEPACPPDHLGLSFGIDIPLNMAEKQMSTYTVSVNGKETSFDWSGSGSK